jgi:hypothetical protein
LVYPEADSSSAQLYLEKCTGCHNAPQPKAHTARVWSRVLQRMQVRMKAKGVTPLNNKELSTILDYLQKNSVAVEPK